MNTASAPLHAMTIDVEDYFHVAAFKDVISPDTWDKCPSRVERNTHRILELLSAHETRATFFVLGWVAKRYPSLVRDIDNAGHEIAYHGYSHQLVFEQDPHTFRHETELSKQILEDITGKSVDGYRAASYSVTRRSLWALDILVELGFKWDSSVFPVYHDTYGFPGSPRWPYLLETPSGGTLIEFPLTTAKIYKLTLPAAGGGYFRQYPYLLSKFLFKQASHNSTKPTIFYLHPWEVDPDQPRITNASWKSKFRHYTNLSRCEARLERLLGDFSFGTVSDVMAAHRRHTQLPTVSFAA